MNNTLSTITAPILFEPLNFKSIWDGVHGLHRLFSGITGIAAGDIEDADIYLPSGKAVSPTKAAHCLIEGQRTAVFLRGIYKAILQLKKDFPGERLHILYAGCGPYATLLTPLTAFFAADEVAFHLMDINETALVAAKNIYNEFGLNDYVGEWLCADASIYKVPPGKIMHLMISETMQNALRKEPQVDVMLNLVPQLPPNGLFVPQEITVTANLLSMRLETDRSLGGGEPERINLGTVYTIGTENCKTHKGVTISIPEVVTRHNQLSLLTNITTFTDEKLGIYDTSLTMPFNLYNAEEHKGRQLHLQYELGEVPGFKCEWVG